jgi:phage-related protein
MKIIITEQQKRIILTESTSEELGSIIKKNTRRVKNIIDQAQNQIGMNLGLLLTWGAGIGGFIGPVEDFVRGRYPEMDEREITLVLMGVIATYFIDNKKIVTKIYNDIQENGLSKAFEVILKKSDLLRNTFVDFIDSLGLSFHRVTNMLSYTFIIPLINPLFELLRYGTIENVDPKDLALRIIGFTGATISGIIFKELISKLVRRFKE